MRGQDRQENVEEDQDQETEGMLGAAQETQDDETADDEVNDEEEVEDAEDVLEAPVDDEEQTEDAEDASASFSKKDYAALQNSDDASLSAKAQKYADAHQDEDEEQEDEQVEAVAQEPATDEEETTEDEDVTEVWNKKKYAEKQAAEENETENEDDASLMDGAQKYAESQAAQNAEQEPDDEALEPLGALPEEFSSVKSADHSLKWWAILIIVVGSVLLVAGMALFVVLRCNAEYQVVRDKALSCCGLGGHRYEPVKTAEEEERL